VYNSYQPGEGPEKMSYTADTNCLSLSGWNDKTNSMVVEKINDNGNVGSGNNNGYNNGNYSNNNLVTIYSNCNYGGNSKFFREGRYSMNELGIGDDQISSIKVPSGWSITLYQDPDQRGGTAIYDWDASCLPNGWNDKTSSIRIERGNSNNNGNNNYNDGNLVTLFSDCNYRGTSKSFNEGRYSMSELGIGDDELSSIRVPSGWIITIYQEPNQRGGFMNYSYNVNCLPNPWNNKTSSIWVRRSY
jgi:hypothetical protein